MGGRIIDCHRIYLAKGPQGWTKAPLPDPKKVLTDYTGGSIRLSSGLGPRGGKGCRLAERPPGTRVFISEGIENGLSAIILRHLAGLEPVRVLAASLPGAPKGLMIDFGADDADQERRAEAANARLAKVGVKFIRDRDNPRLFVGGNRKVAGLARLFEGSPWAAGADQGAIGGRDAVSRTLAGIAMRGTEIPLKSMPWLMSFPQDHEAPPPVVYGRFAPEDFA